VPARSRVLILHFLVQAESSDAARTISRDLMNLADPSAFSDLTAEERSQVVNFEIP
jgi:hypothetical protein